MSMDDLTAQPTPSLAPDSSLTPDKRSRWRKLRDWCSRQWAAIRPGPRSAPRRRLGNACCSRHLRHHRRPLHSDTGFGYIFDFAFCILFAAIFIPLVALLVMLLLSIARKLPRSATGVIVGSCMVVMMLWGPPQLGDFHGDSDGPRHGSSRRHHRHFFLGQLRPSCTEQENHRCSAFRTRSRRQHLFHLALCSRGLDGKTDLLEAARRFHAREIGRAGSLRPRAVPRVETFLRRWQRHSPPRIRSERRHQNSHRGLVRLLQGLRRMEALVAQEILGLRYRQASAECARLVSRWSRPISSCSHRSWQSQHGRFLRSGIRVPRRIACQPRHHPRLHRRKFSEQRSFPRPAQSTSCSRLDAARASETLEGMEPSRRQSIPRQSRYVAHCGDGPFAWRRSCGHCRRISIE